MEVRTICLVGHASSGKTALAEALLKRFGRDAKFDFTPEAKSRGHSVDLGVGSAVKSDKVLQILDTPGFGEFVEDVYKGLFVADLAVLVVNAEKGVEVHTEKTWDLTRKFKKPTLILINKMDLPNADFAKALDSLKTTLEGKLACLEWPIREGNAFVGYVDLVQNRAIYFDKRKGEIPGALKELIAAERERLLEFLAEANDDLMVHFLEGQEIPEAEIRAALKTALEKRIFTPVLASAVPIAASLETFVELIETTAPAFVPQHSDGFSGIVFNLHSDQYLGRLAFVKIESGALSEGDTLINLQTGAQERVKEILRFVGDKAEKIPQAGPGEIVALPKLNAANLGDTFAHHANAAKLAWIEFPKPVFARAVTPETQADDEKMSTALKEIASLKATLAFYRDHVTHEAILAGLGDTHLQVFVERLKNRYGVSVKLARPHVPYQETVLKVAQGQYKHKKQSGGRGQYGEAHLRVEPFPGRGYEFVDEIKGGVIPKEFIPAVEKGVLEAMSQGVLAGYPMTDVRVAVFYGSYHEVDSNEISFKIAGWNAFRLAAQAAQPVLLEPIYKVTVWTPSEYTGDIISSLNGKRGKILGMGIEEEHESGAKRIEKIEAEVPLAEMLDYALELKSITQGRATFQMDFARYQMVTSEKLTEELLKREGRSVNKAPAETK
ncbi:MAG: elongation factor G [Candidatus Bipolaricaulota bacterium]|nr:elongation factor G [Candidatus Bipolaricaulota bacterium]MCS7274448.1 elongation factor G [Candidatus Bipolaricaulota bacterium]MDW8110877.1 elongation factor G [Candidatus Bipolaricaulota bacterium]MDW8329356.1 elongation factor G [Candidatus Bipolaricaulota bacterium]